MRTLLVLSSLITLAACSGNDSTFVPDPDPGSDPRFTTKEQHTLKAFADCGAFKDYVADALTLEYTTAYWAGFSPCWSCEDDVFLAEGAPVRAVPVESARSPDDQALDSDDAAAPTVGESAGGNRRVNDTNTQEEGVDEADLVEASSDGQTVYFLRRSDFAANAEVLVFDASDPAAPEIAARIPIETGRYVSGIYLDEENARLLILSEGGFFFPQPFATTDAAIFAPEPGQSGSVVLSYDVSNPASPSFIGQFETDAQIIGSRRIAGRLHLVSQWGIPLPTGLQTDSFYQLVYEDYYDALSRGDTAEQERIKAEIGARVSTAVADAPLAELLPRNNGSTLACTAVQAPDIDQRLGLIQVTSMGTDTGAPQSVGLLNNGWQIYGSQNSLYISQTSGGWWFDPAQVQQTAIHRFALDATAAPAYAGSGVIEGWAANSYQFSEFEDHLRVATTLQGPVVPVEPELAPPRITNRLSVLALENDGLELVAQTPTFGPNEDIRSARFLGERGFVVTFEQIDPLFSFDLSDPRNPRILDALEIPGFSSYIYPLSPDRLLTIGRTAGPDGRGVGNSFQLQIFDVAGAFDGDPNTGANQLLVEEITLGAGEYAFSLAEYEPLAFNFLADADVSTSGLLSIPVQIGSPDPNRSFSGFFAYEVEGGAATPSIEELLRINHAVEDSGNGSSCPGERSPDPESGLVCSDFAPVIYNEPLRTKILAVSPGGALPVPGAETRYVYTFSSRQLKVDTPDTGPLGGQSSLATIPYPEDSPS